MNGRTGAGEVWARLSAKLDDLEYHRAFDVTGRLDQAGSLTRKLMLTVSIGASEALARDTQSLLLGRADYNLYAAKAAGRNRVVVGEGRIIRPLRVAS